MPHKSSHIYIVRRWSVFSSVKFVITRLTFKFEIQFTYNIRKIMFFIQFCSVVEIVYPFIRCCCCLHFELDSYKQQRPGVCGDELFSNVLLCGVSRFLACNNRLYEVRSVSRSEFRAIISKCQVPMWMVFPKEIKFIVIIYCNNNKLIFFVHLQFHTI